MRIIILFLLFVCNQVTVSAQHVKTPMKVTDLLNIKSIGGVTLNKEGTKVAYTVTSIEPDGDSKWEHKYVTHIWMSETDGTGQPRQLTARENASQPTFSPDGKQLAFVRSVDGKSQIFLLALDGGEAKQLTRFRYGANGPKWSPDGKQILFSANIPLRELLKDSMLNPGKEIPAWPFEKPGFEKNNSLRANQAKPDPDGTIDEVRAYLDINATDKKARVVNKLNFQDETDVNPEMGFNHFFIIDASTGSKPMRLTRGFYRFNFAEFTPDGKKVILAGDIDSLQHPDRSLESSIYIVNSDGKELRKLLGEEGKSFNSPAISPGGKWLAFQYGTTSFVRYQVLGMISLSDPAPVITDIPFDLNKSNLTWSNDDRYIYFTSPSSGGNPLYRADPVSKKSRAANRLQ